MRHYALILALLCLPLLRASAASIEDEVRAADHERVLALLHGDNDRLASLFASGLHYGHYDGRLQTKDTFLSEARASAMKWVGFDYLESVVTPVTADVAIMNARARLRVRTGEEREEVVVQFLTVWKKENGAWHLFAHQSSKMPDGVSPMLVAPAAK